MAYSMAAGSMNSRLWRSIACSSIVLARPAELLKFNEERRADFDGPLGCFHIDVHAMRRFIHNAQGL